MGERYLIDSNVLVDTQIKRIPEKGLRFVADVIDKNFTISFVSYIEFLGYPGATSEMEEFVALSNIIQINMNIIGETINLRKKYIIKLPDAIIAATAIHYNRTLLTRNIADFKKIERLKLLNPYEI